MTIREITEEIGALYERMKSAVEGATAKGEPMSGEEKEQYAKNSARMASGCRGAGVQIEHPGGEPGDRQGLVAGQQHRSAARRVARDQIVQRLHAAMVKRVIGFIQQPDGRMGRKDQARQRDPSPLPLAEGAHRRMGSGGDP